MKIYFTASLTGKKDYDHNYEMIIKILKELGYEVETSLDYSVDGDSRLKESLENRENIHKKIMKAIAGSDLIVVESSYSSTNVGYEINSALDREKPVLVLHVEGKVPVLLLGAKTERMRIVEYSSSNIKDVLKMYLKELSETVDTRFNFFISRKLLSYLDWIAKKRRIPRAVYLRQLIKREMRKYGEISSERR